MVCHQAAVPARARQTRGSPFARFFFLPVRPYSRTFADIERMPLEDPLGLPGTPRIELYDIAAAEPLYMSLQHSLQACHMSLHVTAAWKRAPAVSSSGSSAQPHHFGVSSSGSPTPGHKKCRDEKRSPTTHILAIRAIRAVHKQDQALKRCSCDF